jgi:hypothetical protein
MPKRTDPAQQLSSIVSDLRAERELHARALARIDAVFEQIGIAASAPKRRGRRPGPMTIAASGAPAKRRRRRRRKFAMSGNESILTFVKGAGRKGATTAEVVKHWKSEGRSGDGYTALGELVKAKKLKRESLKGQKGSRYTLA